MTITLDNACDEIRMKVPVIKNIFRHFHVLVIRIRCGYKAAMNAAYDNPNHKGCITFRLRSVCFTASAALTACKTVYLRLSNCTACKPISCQVKI